ncbi:MAG: RnfABCDGE type electron transport complex subunit D [Clostridia bacterium]|jgi:electron transport complex protein RnfD|nr:RnfABCDGE type electron transport complex subunit D [Clostridia bacterium]MDD4146027.1 RnfABCDGE type electron transport complex subunit D [Clostridia bacterium]MDD4665608.1 RnfABCDGE type electron transport complex subunit D [Clostridia bacterium]
MNNQDNLLIISSSPHLHSRNSVTTAMRDVLIALTPALIASLYFFRLAAAKVILTCIFVAVLSEVIAQKIMKKEVTVDDYSAVVTGLLLAFCLPATLPLWMAAVGAGTAIIIGKQLFGGLGNNIFNPALVGRAVLLASWPVAMTTWTTSLDGVTTATPLGMLKGGMVEQLPSLWQLFTGNVGGSLGETCALALIIGALYLLYKGHINWRIPFSYLGTVFVLTALLGAFKGEGLWYPCYHLLAGGLLLGAFFMATDWVTSPLTKKGKFIFGFGCGLLTVLIRLKGGYPEGVCYSILLMNMVTPLLDRYTKARVFGGVSKHA